jgi:uncharacterized protein
MSLTRHLVIFARWPQLGSGKRRLAAGVGAVEALRFQRVALSLTVMRLGKDRRWTTWLGVTPDTCSNWPSGLGVLRQGAGDLGQRMARVAKTLPPGPVLIIGSDIPGIGGDAVARAFRALGDHDVVFGPATDGGFWAIGLRRRPHFVDPFRGVRWSTEHALEDSMRNLSGHAVTSVDRFEDVDDAQSLARQSQWGCLYAFRRR